MLTFKELYDGMYDVVCKYFFITPFLTGPASFLINAPFGRFAPSNSESWTVVDGIKAWIIMEIISPLSFGTTFFSSPLTRPVNSLTRLTFSPPPMLTNISFVKFAVPNAPTLLALMFLGHYLNRAFLSPLRTPGRSKFHISIPLMSALFNVVNGSLMGSFVAALASPEGRSGLEFDVSWSFWIGVIMWGLGFASNIWHDEVLLDLRRVQKTYNRAKPHYAIPHGGLYGLISYPNYLSEWIEWLGYAIAASALTAQLPSTHAVFPFSAGRSSLGILSRLPYIQRLTPPWIFFLSEVFFMFPRAWNGHKWYHKTFPDYPCQRKAVVPFLL